LTGQDVIPQGCIILQEGRLASITEVYLPGRDRNGFLDAVGWVSVLAALLGVGLHGLGRFFIL
jgi:hypothetical protein